MQDTTRQMDELLSEIMSLHETHHTKDNRIADLEQQLFALQA